MTGEYTHIKEVTLEDLKKRATLIHYFGLGFIQIKLEPHMRIHFYTKELPPIVDEEDIHDHRYDFISTILYGNFHQELFKTVEGDTHILEEESCMEGDDRERSGINVGIERVGTQDFNTGSRYSISHDTFHRVKADEAITFLVRSDYRKKLARVVKEKGNSNICPFSKKIPEKELWEIVEKMLQKAQKDRV